MSCLCHSLVSSGLPPLTAYRPVSASTATVRVAPELAPSTITASSDCPSGVNTTKSSCSWAIGFSMRRSWTARGSRRVPPDGVGARRHPLVTLNVSDAGANADGASLTVQRHHRVGLPGRRIAAGVVERRQRHSAPRAQPRLGQRWPHRHHNHRAHYHQRRQGYRQLDRGETGPAAGGRIRSPPDLLPGKEGRKVVPSCQGTTRPIL